MTSGCWQLCARSRRVELFLHKCLSSETSYCHLVESILTFKSMFNKHLPATKVDEEKQLPRKGKNLKSVKDALKVIFSLPPAPGFPPRATSSNLVSCKANGEKPTESIGTCLQLYVVQDAVPLQQLCLSIGRCV